MAITRTQEVAVADVWGNDEDGITVEVDGHTSHLTIDEAEQFGLEILNAAVDQRQTIADRQQPAQDITEPAL